jgi:CBS domain-containing protein
MRRFSWKALGDIMTVDPETCVPDTDVVDAVGIFVERKSGAIPIMEGDEFVAILTQIDVMRVFLAVLKRGTLGRMAEWARVLFLGS